MTRKKQTDNQYSESYQVIFKKLQNDDADASEISSIKKESEEIDELRKIVLEINEPENIYATASNVSGLLPNFGVNWNNLNSRK
jgi:uncharacterized membrane-anchored protein YjiN (DUF445 family)